MASPHADGYHRRHACVEKGHTFYTLAPYDGKDAELQNTPFTDRALTEEEVEERQEWWREEDNLYPATITPRNFIHRCRIALATPVEERNEADAMIVSTLEILKEEVEKIDDEN